MSVQKPKVRLTLVNQVSNRPETFELHDLWCDTDTMVRITQEQLHDKNSVCISEYDSVEKVMDASMALYAADFDANAIRIIGKDVTTVDFIRGKLTPFSSFLSGVVSGLFMMMLVTMFMVVFSEKLFLLVTSNAMGLFGLGAFILAGALFLGLTRALTLYWTSKMTGRPAWRLRTIRQMAPGYYELHVTKDANIARSILTTKGLLGRSSHMQVAEHQHMPDQSPSDTVETKKSRRFSLGTKAKPSSRNVSDKTGQSDRSQDTATVTKSTSIALEKPGESNDKPSETSSPEDQKPSEFGSRPDEEPRYGVRLPRNDKGEIIYPSDTQAQDKKAPDDAPPLRS